MRSGGESTVPIYNTISYIIQIVLNKIVANKINENVKKQMAKLGQIRGLEGRDPRRTYFPEELCILKRENIIFEFYIFTKMFVEML